MAKSLLHGFGINDANYHVRSTVGGKYTLCPFYCKWASMIARCYSENYQKEKPTYIGCKVCDDWSVFSNFKSWMEQQDWKGKELDKDLLVPGNKIYSPETCVFIDRMVNQFLNGRGAKRGDFPIGVSYSRRDKSYRARCRNPFHTKGTDYVGDFDCPNKAHLAWKKRKHELACMLADQQSDPRIAVALRARYAD